MKTKYAHILIFDSFGLPHKTGSAPEEVFMTPPPDSSLQLPTATLTEQSMICYTTLDRMRID